MVDVPTTVWGFIKQTIGGNRNTWGGILNANFDLVEAALAGLQAKALTGGSVTLTEAERLNRILSFTGTLGSNSTITVEDDPNVWLVKNGTSGAFTVSMKTSGGAAVEIPQGGWSLVWCDGDGTIYVGPSSLLFSSQFKAPDGTISAPGLGFLNETTLGIRRAGYATGTLSSNPFTTADTTATVTVAHTAHGLAVGDYAWYGGATAAGGITVDGLYPVASVPDADHYTITHSAVATSTATGGGTPTYKYMKAAATSGGAIAITKGGADIAHVSPYGVILTGALFVTGAVKIGGALSLIGALSAAAAAFTGTITGVAATLTGLLTLSSTSHWLPPRGTTAQRPGGTTQGAERYNTTLDQPEFQDVGGNWRQPSLAQPIAGQFKKLVIQNNAGTPNTQIDIDADEVTVETSAGVAYRLRSIDLTINFAVNGANGLDASGLANDTWYYSHVIYNPATDTVAGLGSLSATAPTLPSGYTALGQFGEHRTNGSAQFHRTLQKGNRTRYVVGASVTTALRQMVTPASVGSPSAGPTVAVSVSAFVPPNATCITALAAANGNGASVVVAPNNSYAGASSTTNAPPLCITLGASGFGGITVTQQADLMLESSNLYWASNAIANYVACVGWDK